VTLAAERGLVLRQNASARDHLSYVQSLPWTRHTGKLQHAILVGIGDPPGFRVAADQLFGTTGSSDERVAAAFKILTWGNPADGDRLRLMMCPSAVRTADERA
jgi:hypothetical protein